MRSGMFQKGVGGEDQGPLELDLAREVEDNQEGFFRRGGSRRLPGNATGLGKSCPLEKDLCEEKRLPSEGDRALGQAAQRGCGVFFSGEIPNPPGHRPVRPALGDPALAGGWMR